MLQRDLAILSGMILINVKFKVRPEYVETFRDEAAEFTNATRAEPGFLTNTCW